jgi:plastocyanin
MGCVALVALMLAAACGGGSNATAPTTTPTTTLPPASGAADLTITISGQKGNMSFSPNPATVKVGQKVAWRNADNIAHTATANAGGFDTGIIGAGMTSNPVTATTAGSADYHCQIHPSMVGTLNVTQ